MEKHLLAPEKVPRHCTEGSARRTLGVNEGGGGITLLQGPKKCKLDCDVDTAAWSSVLRAPLNRRSRLIIPESSVR